MFLEGNNLVTKCNDCGRKIDEDTLGFIAYEICLACYLEQ